MRLLHVIAGAKVGGAETFAQDAIVALHQRGVAQRVLARPHAGAMRRYAEAGIPAEKFGFSPLDRTLRRGRDIRAAAVEADLVHAWMSRAAGFIPPRMPCPVIGWFGDYYDLKYFRRVDFFFAVTPDISRHAIAHGARPHRVFTLNTFGTMPDAPPLRRADLDTPDDAPVLLVLARLHAVKGIDTMLRALALLPGAYLWLAGDGPARAEYQALADRLGLSDRVRFLGWRNDRKSLLAACDICVLPSRHEPFGTVIAEAWAVHTPLVASNADGARQYVEDGTTGLIFPIDDAPALAACVQRLGADPVLAERLAAAGHAAYRRDFTRDIVIDRLIAAYQRCLRLGGIVNDRTIPAAHLAGAAPAEVVARSYADSGDAALAADAARLEQGFPGALLRGRGSRRVLKLPRLDLDHALGLLDSAAETPALGPPP